MRGDAVQIRFRKKSYIIDAEDRSSLKFGEEKLKKVYVITRCGLDGFMTNETRDPKVLRKIEKAVLGSEGDVYEDAIYRVALMQ